MDREEKINYQNITGRRLTFRERFLLWFVPATVVALQRLLGLTLRRINVNKENTVDPLMQSKQPWIYSIWHTNVFFSPYLHRGQNVHVLISESRDGEWIFRIVRHFGNTAIRGSTTRGGIKALKTLIKILREGNPAAVTPDGPKGPAFQVQDGLIIAAMRTGVPVIPFHYEATRQWVFEKAWDRHRIPKPFSTLVCRYGDPMVLDPTADFDRVKTSVQEALLDNVALCQKEVENRR